MNRPGPLKLKQSHFTRKRFVVGELFSFEEASSMYQTYHQDYRELLEQTTFNVVSDTPTQAMKYFIYPDKKLWQTAFDVVGVPQTKLKYKDFDQLKVMKYQMNEQPWLVHFDEIHQKSLPILKSLAPKLGELGLFYQIVIYGNNLELHFFG